MSSKTDEETADRMHGLFAGQFKPEEYWPLIKAGLLYFSYEGVSGFMGLAKLKRVIETDQDVHE